MALNVECRCRVVPFSRDGTSLECLRLPPFGRNLLYMSVPGWWSGFGRLEMTFRWKLGLTNLCYHISVDTNLPETLGRSLVAGSAVPFSPSS